MLSQSTLRVSIINLCMMSQIAPHKCLAWCLRCAAYVFLQAQVVVAIQMVVEEKLLTRYKVPVLQAVGWEGFFGMVGRCCLYLDLVMSITETMWVRDFT